PPIPYRFFMSTDGATSWNRVTGLPTHRFIRSLVISARMPGTMYAATSAGLFKSTDSGSNWNSANFGMDASSVFALAIDPQDANTLYAGTTRGYSQLLSRHRVLRRSIISNSIRRAFELATHSWPRHRASILLRRL